MKKLFPPFSRAYNNARQRRSIVIIMIISYDFFLLPSIFLFDWLQRAVLCVYAYTSWLRLIHTHIHQIVKSYSLITHIYHIILNADLLSLSRSLHCIRTETISQWHIFTFWSHTFAFCVILKIMKIYSPSPFLLFRPVSFSSSYSERSNERGSEHIEK